MSKYSKKGYVSLKFKDPRTGQLYWQAVKIGSGVHKNWLAQRKKWDKQQAADRKLARAAAKMAKKDPRYSAGRIVYPGKRSPGPAVEDQGAV